MADLNEQPMLLNQDSEEGRKPRRPRAASASKPKKTSARRTAARRPKKENDQSGPINVVGPASASINSEELPGAGQMADPKAAAPEMEVFPNASKEGPALQRKDMDSSAFRDRDNGGTGEKVVSMEEARTEEAQPAVEPPKYEPVLAKA